MDLTALIRQPKLMDKETLYQLRSLVALYPYHQAARLLMLHNLYLLHDPSFDEELRRAAIYITDRRAVFNIIEAPHYAIKPAPNKPDGTAEQAAPSRQQAGKAEQKDRTISLIDSFIESIPAEEPAEEKKQGRRPTPADATVDYIGYLEENLQQSEAAPELKGQSLIDRFINSEGGRIQLKDTPEYTPETPAAAATPEEPSDGLLTETLAQIYIKQGRYSRALEIIQQLNLHYPKKNIYFADQIRFLKKLIENESKKTTKQ